MVMELFMKINCLFTFFIIVHLLSCDKKTTPSATPCKSPEPNQLQIMIEKTDKLKLELDNFYETLKSDYLENHCKQNYEDIKQRILTRVNEYDTEIYSKLNELDTEYKIIVENKLFSLKKELNTFITPFHLSTCNLRPTLTPLNTIRPIPLNTIRPPEDFLKPETQNSEIASAIPKPSTDENTIFSKLAHEKKTSLNELLKSEVISAEKIQQYIEQLKIDLNSSEDDVVDSKIKETFQLINKLKFDVEELTTEQIKALNIIKEKILSENGLIKDYLLNYKYLENFTIKSQQNHKYNIFFSYLHFVLNKAMHILSKYSSAERKFNLDNIIDSIVKADKYYIQNEPLKAKRYLSRAQIKLSYLTKPKEFFLNGIKLSDNSKNYFNINILPENYKNYSVIYSFNIISTKIKENYSEEKLIFAKNLLKNLIQAIEENDNNKFDIELDNCWSFIDSLKKI